MKNKEIEKLSPDELKNDVAKLLTKLHKKI